MSAAPIRTRRKNAFNALREAEKLMSFDEFPMIRPEVDPQIHLSRNEVDQPFYLVCEKDCVLAQLTGRSRVHFHDANVRWFDLAPGEFVYVPAGYGHRILTREPGAQIRYKANNPGSERVFWLCDTCGHELFRHEWDASTQPAQTGYQDAAEAFNTDAKHRTCQSCGRVHDPIDLSPFRWRAVAEALVREEEEDA